MHVPYDVFWHLNPKKLKPFEKAYEMEIESRQNAMNLEAWLKGLYNQHAIASIMAKNSKYPTEPFEMFGKAREKTPEEEAQDFKFYAEQMAAKARAAKALG